MATSFSQHAVQYEDGKKTISYLAAGPENGPLLIFVHGWPAIGKTWRPQLISFASLGFRVLAPDMPGYGDSTADRKIEDYSMESIVGGMLALLAHTGRNEAVWAGHDFGSVAVSALAGHHPEVCKAVVFMSVPYLAINLGLQHLISTTDRTMYPEGKYPNGPWDYQAFYEKSFDKAISFFEANIEGTVRLMTQPMGPEEMGKPSPFSIINKNGGFFGGAPAAPPAEAMPAGLLDEDLYRDMVAAFKKTGYWPPTAWYLNHKANRAYTLEKSVNGGVLDMPVLFMHGLFDTVCEAKRSRLAEVQRKSCKNLTEVTLECGHWLGMERPEETNAAITRFLVEEVTDYWPGFWTSGSTRTGR